MMHLLVLLLVATYLPTLVTALIYITYGLANVCSLY